MPRSPETFSQYRLPGCLVTQRSTQALGNLSKSRRCVMRTIVFATISLLAVLGARADEAGTKITGEELRSLANGANVTHVNRFGSLRRWTNEPDGTLLAWSSNQKHGSAMSTPRSGHGRWSIDDKGKYCIEIDWKRDDEKWCAFIVKAADSSYYLNSVDPSRKIEFAK